MDVIPGKLLVDASVEDAGVYQQVSFSDKHRQELFTIIDTVSLFASSESLLESRCERLVGVFAYLHKCNQKRILSLRRPFFRPFVCLSSFTPVLFNHFTDLIKFGRYHAKTRGPGFNFILECPSPHLIQSFQCSRVRFLLSPSHFFGYQVLHFYGRVRRNL